MPRACGKCCGYTAATSWDWCEKSPRGFLPCTTAIGPRSSGSRRSPSPSAPPPSPPPCPSSPPSPLPCSPSRSSVLPPASPAARTCRCRAAALRSSSELVTDAATCMIPDRVFVDDRPSELTANATAPCMVASCCFASDSRSRPKTTTSPKAVVASAGALPRISSLGSSLTRGWYRRYNRAYARAAVTSSGNPYLINFKRSASVSEGDTSTTFRVARASAKEVCPVIVHPSSSSFSKPWKSCGK